MGKKGKRAETIALTEEVKSIREEILAKAVWALEPDAGAVEFSLFILQYLETEQIETIEKFGQAIGEKEAVKWLAGLHAEACRACEGYGHREVA